MDYKKIGSHIRSARRQRKLTQEEVSEMAGISISYYGHLERGTRKASLETLFKLCTILNLSMDVAIGLPLSHVNEALVQYLAREITVALLETLDRFQDQYSTEEEK